MVDTPSKGDLDWDDSLNDSLNELDALRSTLKSELETESAARVTSDAMLASRLDDFQFANFTVGTATTSDTPYGEVIGVAPDFTLNFGLPKGAPGDTGPKGDQGPQGDRGETGLQGDTGATGPKGDTGAKGNTGDQGPKGDTGDTGPAGPASLNWRMVWDAGTTYAAQDAVYYDGSSYRALSTTTGDTPAPGVDGDPWQELAIMGQQGLKGDTGNTGPKGDIGDTGPKGDTGDTGATGATGDQGIQGIQGIPGTNGTNGADGADGADATVEIPISTKTASYTLVLADAGTRVEGNSASALSITVPTNTSAAFPTGTPIEVAQIGVGQITIVPAAGVTLRYAASLTTRAQWSVLLLIKRGTNEWVVSGDAT